MSHTYIKGTLGQAHLGRGKRGPEMDRSTVRYVDLSREKVCKNAVL